MTQADSVHSTPPLNTSALTPIPGLDWLDIREDTPPADIFRAIGRLRQEARDEIDRLIRFLDQSESHMNIDDEDGNDAEPDTHDEPSLGFLETVNQERIDQGRHDYWTIDREVDTSDDEPSLGSGAVHEHSTQALWAVQGQGVVDAEQEHDGAEPEEDSEPSLGSFDRLIDQEASWSCTAVQSFLDFEHDDCEGAAV